MNRRHDGARRARAGISLIEIVVACTLLALTLTGLTGLYAKLARRQQNIAVIEQRNATLMQELSRVETLPYDSLATTTTGSTSRFLVNDSMKAGNIYYVWRYTVDPESSGTLATTKYRKITLTVIPKADVSKKQYVDTTAKQVVVIRREKVPYRNVFNTGS
jgi:type II secretory pathway component PulJ